jgi:hypothetical protein
MSMAIEIVDAASHADGVYFGLPKLDYLLDPALGSHDMVRLAYSPPDYWYFSAMNPLRPALDMEQTPAQAKGTAVHVLVLEGELAFDRLYSRGPDQGGMTSAEKAQSTRKANERAAAVGKVALKAADYDRIAVAGAMISQNPRLRTAFEGGAAEVSVIWTEPYARDKGTYWVRKKARIDYLKPRAVGDLKMVSNQYEVPFPRACINAITSYNYHVQAKHYLDARAVMRGLLDAGHITGRAPDELLNGIRDAKLWAWQWVFWQGERAPITWSRVLSPGNPMLELGAVVIERGVRNFLEFSERFGSSMWIEEAEPKELFVEDMPAWFGRD